MPKINDRGFSPLFVIISCIVVGLIVLVGVYTYTQNTKDKNDSTTETSQQTPKKSSDSETEQASTFLTIKQWGIQVKLGAADPEKLTYTLVRSDDSVELVQLSLKSSVTTDTSCQSLGISINRVNTKTTSIEIPSTGTSTIGSYTYFVSGSPFFCENDALDTLRKQYFGDNPQQWQYSVVE